MRHVHSGRAVLFEQFIEETVARDFGVVPEVGVGLGRRAIRVQRQSIRAEVQAIGLAPRHPHPLGRIQRLAQQRVGGQHAGAVVGRAIFGQQEIVDRGTDFGCVEVGIVFAVREGRAGDERFGQRGVVPRRRGDGHGDERGIDGEEIDRGDRPAALTRPSPRRGQQLVGLGGQAQRRGVQQQPIGAGQRGEQVGHLGPTGVRHRGEAQLDGEVGHLAEARIEVAALRRRFEREVGFEFGRAERQQGGFFEPIGIDAQRRGAERRGVGGHRGRQRCRHQHLVHPTRQEPGIGDDDRGVRRRGRDD